MSIKFGLNGSACSLVLIILSRIFTVNGRKTEIFYKILPVLVKDDPNAADI